MTFTNVSGKVVLSKNYGAAETITEIENLPKGMYFVVLNTKNNNVAKKTYYSLDRETIDGYLPTLSN